MAPAKGALALCILFHHGGAARGRALRSAGQPRARVHLCAPTRATMRPLSLADLDAVVELDLEAHPLGLWTREQYSREVAHAQTFAIGAFGEAGSLLGMLFMSTVLDEAMLTNLAVARSVRRRGLATRLLDAALAEGREAGMQLFVLEVREANRAAQALYLSRGFVKAGRRRGYYERPRDDAAVLLLQCHEDGCGAEPPEGGQYARPDLAHAAASSAAAIPSAALRSGYEFELRALWPG